MYIKMYIMALIVFLIIDAFWLGFIAKNLYQKGIGHLMAAKPNFVAAAIFYVIFLAGLVYFVIAPGIEANNVQQVMLAGALFGAITYGTYDLTNLATLKSWPINITIIDIIWGTFLATFVSTVTFYLYILFK